MFNWLLMVNPDNISGGRQIPFTKDEIIIAIISFILGIIITIFTLLVIKAFKNQ